MVRVIKLTGIVRISLVFRSRKVFDLSIKLSVSVLSKDVCS
jgi:hypothetical protein